MASVTYDDLPDAAPAISFDDLPNAEHGLRFDDLPDADTIPAGHPDRLEEIAASQPVAAPRMSPELTDAVKAKYATGTPLSPEHQKELERLRRESGINPVAGTFLDQTPESLTQLTAGMRPEAGIDALAASGIAPGKVNLGGFTVPTDAKTQEDVRAAFPNGEDLAPIIQAPTIADPNVAAGILNAGLNTASGLTTPENLAFLTGIGMAPKAIQQAASLGFSATMLKDAYDQLSASVEGETSGQKSERITQGILTLIMGGAAGVHGTGARAPISPIERAASMEKARADIEATSTAARESSPTAAPAAEPPLPAGERVQSPSAEPVTPLAETQTPSAETRSQPPVSAQITAETAPAPDAAKVKSSVDGGETAQTALEKPVVTPEPLSIQERTKLRELRAKRWNDLTEAQQIEADALGRRERIPDRPTEFRRAMDETAAKQEAIDAETTRNRLAGTEKYTPAIRLQNGTVVKSKHAREGHGELSSLYPDQKNEHGFVNNQTGKFMNVIEVARENMPPVKPSAPDAALRAAEGAKVPEGAKGVEGANLGPGAANANEPLASYEARKFGERFIEDKSIDPTIREQTGNRYYEPLPNRVTAEEATKIISERGIDEATRLIRDEKNDVSLAVRSTVGQVVIKQLNESYRKLKETNPAEADKVLDKAVDLAEWQMEYGTRLGQGVQSFAMWSRLTPEGKLRTYVKAVDKARVRVEKETGGEVKKVAAAAREVSERTETKAKEDAIEREADRISRHLSDTPEFGKKKAPNEAVQLIREHLRKEVPDFTERLQELGATPETAASIDRMATENRKRIAAVGREQRIEALRKRLTAEKNTTGKKLKKSTMERLMELADDGLLKDKEVWDAVSKDLGLPEYTPEIAREMAKLAADVDAASEGIPRNEAMQRLTDYMARNRGFAPGDLPMGIWYANVLSGYQTHVVNAVDTGLNVMSELGTMALTNPKEIPVIVRGVIRGLAEGKADALLALSEGRKITDGKYAEQPGLLEASKFGTKGGVPIQTKGIVSSAMKRAAESKPAKFLNAYKYVGRLMAASDTVFFRAAEEARAATMAFREAEAKGVEKSQLRAEADKLLGYDRIEEFRTQAKAEGYTGAKAEARTTELMMHARPELLRESAADFAGNATYNHAPEGLLGYFANTLSQVSNKVPPLKLIVPFTRIIANVTNRGLDWTPWGYRRALAGRTFGDGPMFGEARTAELTKATVGTVGLAAVGILNQLGVLELHGGGPSDPEKKKQLQASGWKPYSIKIGDTYISYLPTPLGLGFSTLGNYLDANRYQELKQKDIGTRTTYAVSRIASTVFNQSFLSGLAGFMEIIASSSPGKQIAGLKQFFARTASGFTVPNILKDVNRIFDPTYRDSNSIAEDLIRDIPVIRLSLNPTLNAFGEPAEPPSNRFVSVRKGSPEWRLIAEKNLRIPVADDTVFTDPKAGYEYQKLAGQGMKSYITGALPSLKNKTQDQAQEAITRASASIFENARARIRSKYPNSLRQRK